MAECKSPSAPSSIAPFGSRTSMHNQTIVVSKRTSRRPGLPEIDGGQTANFEGANGHKEMNAPIEQQKMIKTDKIARPPSMIPNIQQILAESNVSQELIGRILDVAKTKQNEWNLTMEKSEEQREMHEELANLKLKMANKTVQKATQLFKICEEQGIDLEGILTCRPNVLAQLRLRQQAINVITNCQQSHSKASTPIMDGDIVSSSSAVGVDFGRGENDTTEKEALQSEIHSLEENYSNLFRLYERMRQNCVNSKEVEQQLKADLDGLANKYAALYRMYNELLEEAQKKLDGANQELARIKRENEEKTLGVRLALKRAKIQVDSLEMALQSKVKENKELHRICNELIEARDSTNSPAMGDG